MTAARLVEGGGGVGWGGGRSLLQVLQFIIIMVCLSGLPDRSTFGGATRCLGLLIVCGYCFGLVVPWFGLFLPLLV